ncbi:MAG TPA: hypothetical protein VK558_14525, partial [Patescibacteria group bacterium]|nr:hypothetical protein [Patescibacteria group bacterium]
MDTMLTADLAARRGRANQRRTGHHHGFGDDQLFTAARRRFLAMHQFQPCRVQQQLERNRVAFQHQHVVGTEL